MTASVTAINTGDGAVNGSAHKAACPTTVVKRQRREFAANHIPGYSATSSSATTSSAITSTALAVAFGISAAASSAATPRNVNYVKATRDILPDTKNSNNSNNNNNNNNKNNNRIQSHMAATSNFSLGHTSLAYAAVAATGAASTSTHKNISYAYEEAVERDTINQSLPLLTSAATGSAGGNVTAIDAFNMTSRDGDASDDDWLHLYDLKLSWQDICLIAVFCTFIVITIIGNTLVILAVITTRRLKTVTNCFVMSLAVADLLVGIFVMPPAVAVHLIGSWKLGWVLCDIWISLDVLLCTASILSLCAISVDRYLAVTQPLTYSRKRRSKRLALMMILIVWTLALTITCPPMLGWYEPGRRDLSECRYNQNEGYVIFSAMGSFFIPMAVMIYVYARISCVIASRHDNMTDIGMHNKKMKRYTSADIENDVDHDLSEQELSSSQKQKQAAARTFSNQTIAKEMIFSEGDNGGASGSGSGNGSGGPHCHSLLTPVSTKNGCYELTRPASLRRTPTASSTMTTMTSACGVGGGSGSGSALEQQQQQHWSYGGGGGGGGQQPKQQQRQPPQQLQLTRPHSGRHQHHLSVGGVGGGILVTSPNIHESGSVASRQTRVHHHHHHHGKSFPNCVTSMKKENKTTQTLSIVVGGFIACWLPFFINYLITPFLTEHQISPTMASGLTWLGWFNSAINPFIYAFYSVDFRAAFWRLTCKRFFSGSRRPQFPTNTMSIGR